MLIFNIYPNKTDLFKSYQVCCDNSSCFSLAYLLENSNECAYFTVTDKDFISNTSIGPWSGLKKWLSDRPHKIFKS